MNVRNFFKSFRERYRISVRNQHTDSEVWYMHISPARLLAGFLALALILFIIILSMVAYTPILDLIPGYPGNKSREMLVTNVMKLDSLEQEIRKIQIYNENIGLIMSGKNPVTPNEVRAVDSAALRSGSVQAVPEDALLRAQLESPDGLYALQRGTSPRVQLRGSGQFFAPVRGVLIDRFNPGAGIFGVGVGTAVNQPVMAVLDGTVISSNWTPQDGYVLYIQHLDNTLSVYRNNSSVLKKAGERVLGGEIIGYTGTADSEGAANRNIFGFELWRDGAPVDPQAYIVF